MKTYLFQKTLCLLLAGLAIVSGTLWPRDEDIVGYWPLGVTDGIRDVTGKATTHDEGDGMIATNLHGPFGDAQSSHAVSCNSASCGIFSVTDLNAMALSKSFTVSLFVSVPKSAHTHEVFGFQRTDGQVLFLVYIYNVNSRPQLRIVNYYDNVYYFFDMVYPNDWTFLAISYDATTSKLSVYNRFGLVYTPIEAPNFATQVTKVGRIRVAFSSVSSVHYSCVMIHSAVLTFSEIQRSYDACRTAHGSAACGTSRLPFTPIPNPDETTPGFGQFPFVASLRYRSQPMHVQPLCAATVIDRRHLLTSASCFNLVTPSSVEAYIGEYDFAVAESAEQKIGVKNITLSPGYYAGDGIIGDIAIIELDYSISYDTAYANEMCMPNSELFTPSMDEPAYFFGWGQNGRDLLASKTLPRYTVGEILSDKKCDDDWDDYEDVDIDPSPRLCFESDSKDMESVPCTGDKGAPLMLAYGAGTEEDPERLVQVGVYGKRAEDCTDDNPLPVFARISNYANWLNSQLACVVPGYSYPAQCPIPY